MIILQSETKMKAALGQKVKVSLPKAFQTSKAQTKSLAIKGVPTDITETEFKKLFDLNKIIYAKAKRLKSKKDSRVLPTQNYRSCQSRGSTFSKFSLQRNRNSI